MSANGNRSPYDRGRLNAVPNHTKQDIYGARHNGMSQPGAPVAHPGNGHSGPMNSMGQPQINGAQTHRGTQPQARSTRPGVAPRAGGIAEATPGQ